jgi:ABC-type lipoprotein release transport system permease subunit
MKVLIKIAWRNIWRNSVRSLVIASSIVMGLWIGVFVSALYYGMGEDRVNIVIQSEISHIQIHHPKFKEDYKARYTVSVNDTLVTKLHNTPNVRSWSPRSIAQGMLATTSGGTGIQINGIDPAAEDSTTHLVAKIIDGQYLGGKANQVLIGAKLATRMKLKVKSKIVLTFLDKDDNIASGAFRVAGIFESSNSGWDNANVFIRRQDFNPSLAIDSNAANEIAILLNSNRTIDTTTALVKSEFPQYKVESWMEISPETSAMISLLSQVSIVFVIIILLALSFGIINTMLMAVLERTREIGMLLALGMNRVKVFGLIVFETFFLVMLGCPVAMLLSWGTVQYLSVHGINLAALTTKSTMASYGFSSVTYPSLPLYNYLQIIGLVIVTALLSSIFPAVKALKLNPAETIKE